MHKESALGVFNDALILKDYYTLCHRKFKTDVPSIVTKLAPDFTTVYVINKTKVSSLKTATASAPIKLQPVPMPHPHLLQTLTSSASVDNPPRPFPIPTGFLASTTHAMLIGTSFSLFV